MAYQRQLRQSLTLENGANYRLSINVAALSGINLDFNIAGTGYTISSAGWHSYDIASTGTDTEFTIEPSADTVHNLQVEEVILKKYLW